MNISAESIFHESSGPRGRDLVRALRASQGACRLMAELARLRPVQALAWAKRGPSAAKLSPADLDEVLGHAGAVGGLAMATALSPDSVAALLNSMLAKGAAMCCPDAETISPRAIRALDGMLGRSA